MKRQNQLGSYLAVTTGVGCLSSVANAVITVTQFGPGDGSAPISFTEVTDNRYVYGVGETDVTIGSVGAYTFLRSDSMVMGQIFGSFQVIYYEGFMVDNDIPRYGAVEGDDNFVLLGLGVNPVAGPLVFNAVAQLDFSFGDDVDGFVVAIASVDEGTLSLADGVAAIQAAQVPEPSSLALLALGSVGLIARRNRKKSE